MTMTAVRELAHQSRLLANITPNWFASVMGTGIVATAAATLPTSVPGLHALAVGIWLCAVAALLAISTAYAVHWRRYRHAARRHAADPVMMQFHGAVPMALLTVGAGARSVGDGVLGSHAATAVFVILWVAGTVLGLATSVVVPYVMMTRTAHRDRAAVPAWLMPVVPPMVSASTGALMLPLLEGDLRLAVTALCYALFGLALVAGLMTLTHVHGALLRGGVPVGAAAPTVWIMLGLIGQAITAANLLGAQAATVFTGAQASVAAGLHVFGILVGLVLGGFAVLLFATATALTVHAFRRGVPFSLTWWSFTFPVGTCVTGASALGAALGSAVIDDLAVALFAVLLGAWATVATRTVCGTARGTLLVPA